MSLINSNNEVSQIAYVLKAKSKSTMPSIKTLKEKSRYFSPLYRDFILKVIKNNSLKIVNSNCESYIEQLHKKDEQIYSDKKPALLTEDGELLFAKKLSKRARNTISAQIVDDEDALPHELGHAVDFWFGEINALTRIVLLKDNKTLYEIFTEEFESKHQELYDLVMNEYKNIINSNINDKAYDLLIENMHLYQYLNLIEVNLKDKHITDERRKLQSELYNSGFVETYYQLYEKKCYKILNSKYAPILDALSSKYDFNGLCLAHHDREYYLKSKYLPVNEFFANLFAAKVTSKYVYYDNLARYLPKSLEAFEQLFDIFYERIQNNKRFIDVPVKARRCGSDLY